MQAALEGTKEIALAVFATTMTVVAVFVPVAFMSGIVGQFFRQFGLTVSAAVLVSLFVAFTLDPMLSSRFSKTSVIRDPRGMRRRRFSSITRLRNSDRESSYSWRFWMSSMVRKRKRF